MESVKAQYGSGRERLLRAAAELLVERGGGLEVEPLVERAGTSKALVWRHFGNMEGLIAAVVESFFDDFDASVSEADLLPGAPWATRERARLARTVEYVAAHPLASIVLTRLPAAAGVQAVRDARLEQHIRAAARNIERGQASGELTLGVDPYTAATFIMSGLHHAARLALVAEVRLDELADELWALTAGALRIDPNLPGAV